MFRVLIILIVFHLQSAAYGIDFNTYPNLKTVENYLAKTAEDYPEITKVASIGNSTLGQKIEYITISKDVNTPNKEAIFISASHHGNEKPSTLAALRLVDYLTKNSEDGNIAALLDRFTIHVLPIVNPDGYLESNRLNALHIDINRDFSYPHRSDQDSFKSIEAALVKNFVDATNLKGAIAIHSGMTGVLWPWAYSEKPTKELETFFNISQNAAKSMGLNLFKQSNLDYPTDGELIDYLYMTQKTLAVTFEISDTHMPHANKLNPILNRSLVGMLTYMFNILDYSQNMPISNNSNMSNIFTINAH